MAAQVAAVGVTACTYDAPPPAGELDADVPDADVPDTDTSVPDGGVDAEAGADGRAWLDPASLANADVAVADPKVGMDADGNGFVVWRQVAGAVHQVWSCRSDRAASTWSSPTRLDNVTSTPSISGMCKSTSATSNREVVASSIARAPRSSATSSAPSSRIICPTTARLTGRRRARRARLGARPAGRRRPPGAPWLPPRAGAPCGTTPRGRRLRCDFVSGRMQRSPAPGVLAAHEGATAPRGRDDHLGSPASKKRLADRLVETEGM